MRGLLLVVSGPSGVGKGTVLQRLFEARGDCVFSISATTRAPRPGEVDGVHYHFLSARTFNQWIEEDRFLEWNQVLDNQYGTPREFVDRARDAGRHVILDVDVKGGLEVLALEPEAVSVFIAPPSLEALRERLARRNTESPEQIARRLLSGRSEMKHMGRYRYTVINDSLGEAVGVLDAILTAESSRTFRVRGGGALRWFFSAEGEPAGPGPGEVSPEA